MSQNNEQNPMSEYLLKIQLIINNSEFKNKAEADKYETYESKLNGDAYVRAVTKTDSFESYQYDEKKIYNMLSDLGYEENRIFYLINNQFMLPQTVKNTLMEEQREILIASYVEANQYYIRLTGKPFQGNDTTSAEVVLRIPDEFYSLYKNDNVLERNQPVHEMPSKYQELFMNSDYYKQMLIDNPSAEYLKYIGSNSIPIHVSRKAQDGDILRINTNKLSTYNLAYGNVYVDADIVHRFVTTYKETRDYVYYTLHGDFSSIYPNYDSFIRFLTIYLSIGNTMNEFMKRSTSMIYMNNATANNFFMLYGLPSVIMEGASMISFLKQFRLLLMDKGTNVVYRVKDLIGYEYTDIYTLVMVKQQVFENGMPVYHYDEDGNKIPKQDIVFRRLGTSEDNTSYFKFRDNNTSYTVDEITSGDPRWWNTPEVEHMLSDMNYTLSNSKYIQLSTHLSITDIWWQCVILIRGLLDRKQETQFTQLSLNCNIGGESQLSVFDAVLVLVILMNWHLKDANGNTLKGEMYLYNGTYAGKNACLDLLFNGLNDDGSPKDLILGSPYKISSFNFRIRENDEAFYKSISNMTYVEPDTFLDMLDKVLNMEYNNIGEVLMTDVKIIYDYLVDKLRRVRTISEFRQITDIFNHLFLVDPVRNWYETNVYDSDSIIVDQFNISQVELASLKSFFKETDKPEINITYNDTEYPVKLYDVLNKNVTTIQINSTFPFRDNTFVDLFLKQMSTFVSNALLTSYISSSIKDNYKEIIIDKVTLDVGNSDNGPKTFESLLFRENSELYRKLILMKNDGDGLLIVMRNIVKALERYTNSQLSGLEFQVVGIKEYFNILKEVISYFKSYMIEFTKDEFVYIFDGIFDNGGNSNMLKLCDEINSVEFNILPKDSLTLYDVSCATVDVKLPEETNDMLRDEVHFRIQATYQKILNSGYELWYDDNKRITKTPIDIDPSTLIIADIVTKADGTDILVININNIDKYPPNYVGNVL